MITILDKIRRSGGSIVVLDGKLRIEAPAGTLSDQDKQVLAQHRETLLRLLTPPEPVVVDLGERQAIQWVEALDPAEAEAVVETAVREWDEIVRSDQEVDGWSQPNSDLSSTGQDQEVEVVDLDAWLRENTVEPIPCGKCGGLERWQDGGGSWH